jgi:polyisoprenyl-teichoic acid--peptidoglycan teichoic acid transferase
LKTIENFIGIEIDYYLKMNFKGVVSLVNAFGGIDVNVPYSFCEQDSNRQWGDNTIYVEKGGIQTSKWRTSFSISKKSSP